MAGSAASPYALKVTGVMNAATQVRTVLAYQTWTYWVFRKRIG
ncbi:hypothetical protein [Streptomyces sp. G1]|nr:hypothetical protein [Streptomyces sp. G1]